MFLGLPDPDPLVRGMDTDPAPDQDPSIQCCGSDPNPDPDPPDPYVFGPPGSGSRSFYHHAKIVNSTILLLFLTFYL